MKILILAFILMFAEGNLFASEAIKTDPTVVMQEIFDNQDDIIGVDLLVAGGYENGPFYSRWGHAFLVFINKNEKYYYNNPAISIVADLASAGHVTQTQLYVKGTFGGFNLTTEADYFYFFWDKHVINEGRPLERIIIPLNETIKHNLFQRLKEITENPESMGDYKFVTNNCVGAASRLLRSAGIPLDKIPVIPMNAKRHFEKSNIISTPTEVITSHTRNLPNIFEHLQKHEITRASQVDSKLIDNLVSSYGADSTLAFLNSNHALMIEHGEDFHDRHANKLAKNPMKESFKAIAGMYTLCEDISCASLRLKEEEAELGSKIFSENAFKRHQSSTTVSDENAYTTHQSLLVQASRGMSSETVLFTDPIPSSRSVTEFYLSNINEENVTLNICHSSRLQRQRCDFRYSPNNRTNFLYRATIPLTRSSNDLMINGKPCINLQARSFNNSCGIIKENGKIKIIAY